MKKLYYDCPIIAAYMAEYFEVEFIFGRVEGMPDKHYGWPTEIAMPLDKYYIAEESLHIFEPKEGDVANIKYNIFTSIREDDLVCGFVDKNKLYKIIMRNGKQFFMPKEDND